MVEHAPQVVLAFTATVPQDGQTEHVPPQVRRLFLY